jgi:hypothetical protein
METTAPGTFWTSTKARLRFSCRDRALRTRLQDGIRTPSLAVTFLIIPNTALLLNLLESCVSSYDSYLGLLEKA